MEAFILDSTSQPVSQLIPWIHIIQKNMKVIKQRFTRHPSFLNRKRLCRLSIEFVSLPSQICDGLGKIQRTIRIPFYLVDARLRQSSRNLSFALLIMRLSDSGYFHTQDFYSFSPDKVGRQLIQGDCHVTSLFLILRFLLSNTVFAQHHAS